jgi:hypothetical protein
MDDGSLTIQWGDNVQYVDHCKLSYVNLNGQTVSQKVSPSETTTVISDYSSDLSYTTLFMLIPSTTDTFRVETVSVAIAGILNMDEWTVTASSYEASGGEYGTPDVILINGFEKVWHTRFSGSTAQPPHWIEIDMQNLKQLTRIEITRHTDIKALHIITSETQITDKNSLGDLSPIATLEYPAPWNLKDIMLSRDFENPVSAQYIYFHIPSGHRIYASIQFIKAFGWTQ